MPKVQIGCARRGKKQSKRHTKRHTKKHTQSKRRTHTKKHHTMKRRQRGGVLYTFDNTDMIAGLPAVKAISNCPPGVSATDADWGIKVYEKFKPQKGGMTSGDRRLDIIQDIQEKGMPSPQTNNKKNSK